MEGTLKSVKIWIFLHLFLYALQEAHLSKGITLFIPIAAHAPISTHPLYFDIINHTCTKFNMTEN